MGNMKGGVNTKGGGKFQPDRTGTYDSLDGERAYLPGGELTAVHPEG